MSSEISTEKVRLQADRGLEPWQFFVLAALGCATAVTFIARGQGPVAILLLGALMAAAGLVGYATLRTVRPLVSPEDDRTVMIGRRTRVALEREKLLVLRSIKELEFDRAMGRLSDEDFHEMAGRLRTRAGRLIQQLDAGVGYREQIEKDLAKRMGAGSDDARLKASRSTDMPSGSDIASGSANVSQDARSASVVPDAQRASVSCDPRSASLSGERVCASCETQNDSDARFCKSCGQPLAGQIARG